MAVRTILCPITGENFEHSGKGRPRKYSPKVTLAQIAKYRRQLASAAKATPKTSSVGAAA